MRIIPARAGFTHAIKTQIMKIGDHPRSRGVYSGLAKVSILAAGSSPLARGLQDDVVGPRWWRGIIPARAGFTGRRARRWDSRAGSSPLARGLPGRDRGDGL